MDYETISADAFGRSLWGIGLNLLVRDIAAEVLFLANVFGFSAHQPTKDFAIMIYRDTVLQIRSDGTYHANPVLQLLPENPPCGAGIEIRLCDVDPGEAAKKARMLEYVILQQAAWLARSLCSL